MSAVKFCKDCRYSVDSRPYGTHLFCMHPLVRAKDLQRGEGSLADVVRKGHIGPCDESGKLFEPRPVRAKRWWEVWK